MKQLIREYALKLKADCEEYQSPVPIRLRILLHQFGKWLYCSTYGMTPLQAEEVFDGKYTDILQVVYANRIFNKYGTTINSNRSTSHRIHWSEPALFAIIAYDELREDWIRMCSINGIWLEEFDSGDPDHEDAELYIKLKDPE
ncbi:MAG: hypothetical protein AAFY26_06125 [Cyanobacteria bacterium J06638_22]